MQKSWKTVCEKYGKKLIPLPYKIHTLKIRIKAKSTVKAKENNTQKNQPH